MIYNALKIFIISFNQIVFNNSDIIYFNYFFKINNFLIQI